MTPNMIETLAAERNQLFAAEVAAARRARQCRPARGATFSLVTRAWSGSGAALDAICSLLRRRPDVTLTVESGLSGGR